MPFSLAFLSFYISLESFQRDTTHGGNEIAVCPQTWQPPLELWELLTQRAATGCLDVPHQSVNAELWITSHQEMHMIGHDFHLNELLSPFLDGFQDNSFQPFIYRW